LIRDTVVKDPAGLPEVVYQLRHRDQVVAPSSLDAACRELLHRAQAAIDVALDSSADAPELPEIVAVSTLLQHEWEIAVALREITDLRAEHERNAADSAGPMTAAV